MGSKPLAPRLDIDVTDAVVRDLVNAQFPELLADREFGRVFRTVDEVAVRLGDDLGILLPLTTELGDAMRAAAKWLPVRAKRWTFPSSVPEWLGDPTESFPLPWAVVNWLPGSGVSVAYLPPSSARVLTASLREIHTPVPPDAPLSPTTSRPLGDFQLEWDELLGKAATALGPGGERVDISDFQSVWEIAVAAPQESPVWTHGAISPLSILADNGRFSGICDWLKFGAGDGAVDVAAASLLLPAANALEGRAGYGDVSDAFRARTSGWRHLLMLRWALSDNPFFWRYAWGRILDYGQLADLGVSATVTQRRTRLTRR